MEKLRFKDENGNDYQEWEEKTLGEIGSFFGGLTGKQKKDFEHGDGLFIPYKNVFKNTFADEKFLTAVDVGPNEKQNKVQYGDILFTQSSETVEEVGLTSVWVNQSTPYLNSFCMALRPNNLEINPIYMGYVMRSGLVRKKITKQGQGISRINLGASRIKKVSIPYPAIKEEQQKIGDFFSALDEKINLEEKKLESMRLIKKGLLQQMF